MNVSNMLNKLIFFSLYSDLETGKSKDVYTDGFFLIKEAQAYLAHMLYYVLLVRQSNVCACMHVSILC